MKKIASITLFVALAFIANTSFAQMKEWNWASYKMKFSAPANLRVTENSGTAFKASNGKMNVSIFPRKQTLSYAQMESAVSNWAKASSLSGSPEYVQDLNGYWGCYIEGVAKGAPAIALLLIDPDYTDINLYVWISYVEGMEDQAAEVLKSFTLN